MITTVLFDLDGTLLPMDQEVFLNAYMSGLAAKMAPYGYDPKLLIKSLWKGTAAMVANDGSKRNDTAFWEVFCASMGRNALEDEAVFLEFYQNEFQNVAKSCGFDARAAQTVDEIRNMGMRVVLATNPLFPAMATHSRVKWAGLDPNDFEYITTYENSYHSKPNPDYFREILDKLNLKPEECLMVGNDVKEDMVPLGLGMQVFLLTDCIINKENADISRYPHGSFPELLAFVRSLCV